MSRVFASPSPSFTRTSYSSSPPSTTPTRKQLIGTTNKIRKKTSGKRISTAASIEDEGGEETTASSSTSMDDALLAVAQKAISEIKPGMTIAIGTGSICSKLFDALETENILDVKYVPASTLAAKELVVRGLAPVVDCKEIAAIDMVFLQPNETAVYDGNIVSILDRTQTPIQPSIVATRNVLKKSLKTILFTEQFRDYIGGSIPVEIDVENWESIAEELDDLFLGDAELWRRGRGDEQSHPRGGKNPFVSADGTTIVDIKFEDALKGGRYSKGFVLAGEDCSPFQIQAEIESVAGVRAHGLYTTADAVLAPWGDDGLTPLFMHKGEELPMY